MEKREKPNFPKGFFTQSRKVLTTKEAIKDSIPFKWSDKVLEGKSKVKIASAKKDK